MRTMSILFALAAAISVAFLTAPAASACPDHFSVGVGFGGGYSYPAYYPNYYYPSYYYPVYYPAPYYADYYPASSYYYPSYYWGPSVNFGIGYRHH